MSNIESKTIDVVICSMKDENIETSAEACHWLAMLLDEIAGEYGILSKHLQGAIDELYRAKVSEETVLKK